MKRVLILLFFAVILCSFASAQQSWFEFEVSKEIFKNLELSVSPEVRFEKIPKLKEYFFETGLEYDFGKYFSLGTKYRVGNNIKNSGDIETYGRFSFDAKGKYRWKKFDSQIRIRYTNADDFFDDDDQTNYLRFRYKLDYSIKNLNLKPYAAYEIYRDISEKEFNKARYEGGLMYKLNKHNSFGAYYRMNVKLNKDDKTGILGVVYNLKL
jgi:hypothetical protein